MVNFGSILLCVTAASAFPSVFRRDTAETLANLQAIDSSTRALTNTVNQFDGSLLGALGINGAAQDLEVSHVLQRSGTCLASILTRK